MDGEAGWWTTCGNIGLPPLARVMGVGRQQQQEASQEVGRDLHVHNEMVMKDICKGGIKSGLYGHMKMLIKKGKKQMTVM